MFHPGPLRFIFCCLLALIVNVSISAKTYAAPFEFKQGGVSLVIADPTGEGPDVLLTFPPTANVKHFSLDNPSRVVVDIGIARSSVRSSTTPLSGATLSGIRIGAHPDKIRIVFDLANAIEPKFLPNSAGSLRILLGRPKVIPQVRGGQEVVPKTVAQAPTSSPTPTSTKTVVSSATPTQLPAPIVPTKLAVATPTAIIVEEIAATPTPVPPTFTPTSAPTPTVTSIASAQPRKTKAVNLGSGAIAITSIAFDYNPVDKAPVIRVALSGRSEYKLSKRDERSFSLLLPDARLSNAGTGLPQFPPQDFNGLTFVLAAAKDNTVDISIGVERGIRVTAFVKDQEIWVRAVNR